MVHEWGTFTSFAGSDGVNLEFRPSVGADLPSFVISSSPESIFFKKNFTARQRMETPVTYFYTDVPRTVNVRVDFPQGSLTEWFPPAIETERTKQPVDFSKTARELGRPSLDWGPVRLTPADEFAKIRVRGSRDQPLPAELPKVAARSHYGPARETDSAIVETVDDHQCSYFEKFLFYRGLGNFELPIKFVALGGDRFEVSNSGELASGALLLVRIEDGRVRFTRRDPVGPHSAIKIELPATTSTVDQLTEAMSSELVAAGLYEKEAWAMVNTWRTSWFGENGTRLLYLVPGKLTDELLPLTVEPAPDECVRVLVGRLETLTPEDCRQLVKALAGSRPEEGLSSKAVKAELPKLGRFAEPAVQFVLSQAEDAQTRERLETILSQLRDPQTKPGWAK